MSRGVVQQDLLLRALLDLNGIYTVDAAMRITSWNRRMEELSGLVENEVLGRIPFEMDPPTETEELAEPLRRVIELGVAEKLRLPHPGPKGEVQFQERRLAPLIDHGGTTTGAVVIVEDITEFKRLFEQTIQSEKLAEIGRLSASIAHEVKNPLTVISYAAQLLQREESLSGFQKELLERIEGESDRLKTLTGSLLSFSRARESVRRLTDLNEVVQDVLRLLRFEFSRGGILLEENYGPVPVVDADPNRLKQVFINLFLNAAQAMPHGGQVAVRTARGDGGKIEAVIADSGPGVPAELRDRIFDPFFTTRKEGEGTGLGLYICRNILIEHGGQLLLDSPPGGGAVFRILLPVPELPAL